jgi:hypothetical protein
MQSPERSVAVGLNGSRPSEARDRVLAQLPAERQVEIMQRAEKRGPRPDDPDWLLVETMIEAASMIKDASAEAVASIQAAAVDADVIVRLDRIESKLKGKPFVELPAIPGLGVALVIGCTILACAGGFELLGAPWHQQSWFYALVLTCVACGSLLTLLCVQMSQPMAELWWHFERRMRRRP